MAGQNHLSWQSAPTWQRLWPEARPMAVVEWRAAGDALPNPADWLNCSERRACAGLGHPRRRREWLLARIALKRLLIEEGWIADPCHASVESGPVGKPELRIEQPGGASPRLLCSLSHCAGRVMAACRPVDGALRVMTAARLSAHSRPPPCASLFSRSAEAPSPGIGVDLVRMSSRFARHRRFFAAPGDARFDDTSAGRDAALLWCLKEAAAKALGVGFGSRFRALVCRNLGGGRCAVEPVGAAFRLTGHFQTGGGWARAALGG